MSAASPPSLVLALHSSSDTLGIGLQELAGARGADPPLRLEAFPLGRSLANALLSCVEAVLPAGRWRELGRLAVATGPGGFTGTRLTVVLARTLAQQLGLPLDGIGSFRLIARRRLRSGSDAPTGPFWLVQELPRRGLVAGLYGADPQAPEQLREWLSPRLYRADADLSAAAAEQGVSEAVRLPAQTQLPEDVVSLLELSRLAAASGQPAPWQTVLPIYPTSPVALC